MTSRALCGDLALVNAGDGEILSKEVGKEERGTGGCVDRRSDHATAVDVEINPQRHRLSRSQTNFALEAMVEWSLCDFRVRMACVHAMARVRAV